MGYQYDDIYMKRVNIQVQETSLDNQRLKV